MTRGSILAPLILSFLLVTVISAVIFCIPIPLWLKIPLATLSPALSIYLLYRFIKKPIQYLMNVADQIASSELTVRMPTNQAWEISQLAEFTNYMLERMAHSIERHRQSRDEMQLILSSIEDALWVQDLSGKIELVNPVFLKLFPLAEEDHKVFCWEVIRENDILRIIKGITEGDKPRLGEVTIESHSYLLSASVNQAAGKIIFILQNIDDMKATEKMKRDFAMNVAHELRTPLTAIKGFVDVMHDDDPDNRYLKIIQKHTGRLIALVSDLEDLAKLERAPSLHKQDICLSTFFSNIHSIFESKLSEKQLFLVLDIQPENLRAYLDPFRMEQVFINLIDNAMRYTEKGGITISAFATKASISFTVQDTGSGIDAKHIPRLFERFYTVDHSRSRATGGTGLGLAIVKHIIQSHGGTVAVSSAPQQGTTFHIDLPQP